MDIRNKYVAPAITSDDVLEQTSLQCNVTVDFPIAVVPGGPYAGIGFCDDNNVAKGGLFYDAFSCPDDPDLEGVEKTFVTSS